MWQCQECNKIFRTTGAAERASMNGCPKCGGCDIDLAPLPAAKKVAPVAQVLHPVKPWSVETVKHFLPRVRVRIGDLTQTATLSGRANAFASVHTLAGDYVCDVAWETVVTCLNNNRAILA